MLSLFIQPSRLIIYSTNFVLVNLIAIDSAIFSKKSSYHAQSVYNDKQYFIMKRVINDSSVLFTSGECLHTKNVLGEKSVLRHQQHVLHDISASSFVTLISVVPFGQKTCTTDALFLLLHEDPIFEGCWQRAEHAHGMEQARIHVEYFFGKTQVLRGVR